MNKDQARFQKGFQVRGLWSTVTQKKIRVVEGDFKRLRRTCPCRVRAGVDSNPRIGKLRDKIQETIEIDGRSDVRAALDMGFENAAGDVLLDRLVGKNRSPVIGQNFGGLLERAADISRGSLYQDVSDDSALGGPEG